MRTIRALIITLAPALGLAFAADVHAYAYRQCNASDSPINWNRSEVSLRGSRVSFEESSVRVGFDNAVLRWRQAPIDFRFEISTWTDGSVGLGTSQNEVWFTDDDDLLDGAPARAFTRWWCDAFHSQFLEVDIVFDVNAPWYFGNNMGQLAQYSDSANGRSFRSTAIHELGHALGLEHESRVYNVMGQDSTHLQIEDGASELRAYPGEDASDGAVFLYGLTDRTGGDADDLAVVHWRYRGPDQDDEYSLHRMTRIYTDPNGQTTASNEGYRGALRRYKLKRGSNYYAEFTFENNGKNRFDDVNLGYYVSTNTDITTSDRLLATSSPDLARNAPYTSLVRVTIPSDLEVGRTYYLGAIIDFDDQVPEITHRNNSTYMVFEVVP